MLGQGDKGSPKATVTTVPAQLEHGIAELSSNVTEPAGFACPSLPDAPSLSPMVGPATYIRSPMRQPPPCRIGRADCQGQSGRQRQVATTLPISFKAL